MGAFCKYAIILSVIFISISYPIYAQAEKPRLVLLPLESGNISQYETDTYQSAILEELSKRYEVFSGDQVREKMKKVTGKACTTEECLEKITIAFNCKMLGRGAVKREGDEYLLSFKIKDVFDDKIIESKSEGCKACTKSNVINKLKLMAKNVGGSQNLQFVSGMTAAGVAGITRITPMVSGDKKSNIAVLIFDSDPTGAEVFLNDAIIGETPFQKHDLPPGQTAQFTITKANYHNRIIEIPLSSGINKLDTIKLLPNFGSLSITSEPTGADVYLGGKKVGKTPYYNERTNSRNYYLNLRYPLYLPVENKLLEIKDGKKTEKHFELKPDFGELKVDIKPKGATIVISDAKGNQVNNGINPANFILKSGSYKIALMKNGYTSLDYDVSIARGSKQTISGTDASLRRLEGDIIITSNPYIEGAKIFVDGEEKGRMPATLTLSAGKHDIRISSPEKEGKEKVTIKDRDTSAVKINLFKRMYKRNSIGLILGYVSLQEIELNYLMYGAGCRHFWRGIGYFNIAYMMGSSFEEISYSSGSSVYNADPGSATYISAGYNYPIFKGGEGFDILFGLGFEWLDIELNVKEIGSEKITQNSFYVDTGIEYEGSRFFAELKGRYVLSENDTLGYNFGITIKTGIKF